MKLTWYGHSCFKLETDLGSVVFDPYGPGSVPGLELPELYVENISLPSEVEAALDKRTAAGIVGDLSRYTQFSAAEAMTKAAGTPGSAMGAGIGAGMGMGMGMAMGGGAAAPAGPWGARPAAAPPEPPAPPPAETPAWHLASNGSSSGPFSLSELRAKAADGSLTARSHVWTPGQEGWKAADQTELQRLFAQVPPPPPPAG